MNYLTMRKLNQTQVTLTRGEQVRDHSIFPPLNEIAAVAMMFFGAALVFLA
jgi:hypothetical protein